MTKLIGVRREGEGEGGVRREGGVRKGGVRSADRTELIGVRKCWTELRARREGEGGGRRDAEGGVREGGVRSVGLGYA